MKLAIYVRTSTEDPSEDSLTHQEERCRSWAAEHGHRVVSGFRDNGVSGRVLPTERPGLQEALAAVGTDVDGLLVHRLDRLARELHVQEAALTLVWARGGSMFEASERGEVLRDDPDDPMRTFVRQVMGAAAQLERGMVSLRLRDGRKRKHARGGYAGGLTLPFGQRIEGKGKDAVRVRDEQTAAVVERMRQLRAGGLSFRAIADRLNADGVEVQRGGRWHAMGVKRVLDRAGP